MTPDDNFAFLLPVIMLTFAAAFLIVGRYGSVPARYWGWGHLLFAGAFSVPLLAGLVPIEVQALTADSLFLAGYVLFGQALLLRFGKPRFLWRQIGFALAAFLVVAFFVVVRHSLRGELIAHDIATACLLTFPVLLSRDRLQTPIDKALAFVTGLIVVDTLVRNIVLVLAGQTDDGLESFATSSYAFFMQASASVVGLLFALVALAAVTLDQVARYRQAAENDPLTGLLNRRGFEDALSHGQPATTSTSPGVVLTCDIDHFKRVNDTFGHTAGDGVIKGLADLLRVRLPTGAFVARFGGEEFVAYLPAYTLLEGALIANMVRLDCAARDWRSAGVNSQVTVSFGVACPLPGDPSLHQAIARADAALYRAKRAGRNQVIADEGDPVQLLPTRLVSRR